MPKNWRIRRARRDDSAGLTACVEAAYQHYVARMSQPPGPMLADYDAEIAQHQVWVVEDEGEIVGGLVLIPKDDHVLLDNIAVHPDYQGKGIGRALLELADAEALRQGYAELRLYTHEKMTENIALYSRIGWEETHRASQDGYDRVFFKRRPQIN